MMGKLNILVLHRLGDPVTWRQSMIEKELCLPMFAKEHNYLVHDFWMPLPDYVKEIEFDSIILTQTFLGARRDPKMRKRLEDVFGEILRKTTFKIALPQDDYACSEILDNWMTDWKVDILYTVCESNWDELYPTYSIQGYIRQGYTGYISEDLIERTRSPRPIFDRGIDVAYRAANLSPVYGRLGIIKTEFGERFLKKSKGLALKTDISVRPQDAIVGTRWYEFVENTKCMLGVNSGSSLIDPEGFINEAVYKYLQLHPQASFDEVEAACFPGLDGKYEFTAISPRNLECALFGTVQILAPGAYGGFMKPWEEYIPLEPNMSNFNELTPLLNDFNYLQDMARHCRDVTLSYQELRYKHHVTELIEDIQSYTQLTDGERLSSMPLIERHRKEMIKIAPDFWRKKRVATKVRQIIGDFGLRRLKYSLSYYIERLTGMEKI